MSKKTLKSLKSQLSDLLVDKNPNRSDSKQAKIDKVRAKISKLKSAKK